MIDDLDDILLDDLQRLSGEISDFFNAYNTYEWAYCEGEESIEIALRAEDKFSFVRQRIKNLAIDMGIQGEFLAEYSQRLQAQELKFAA